MARSARAAPRDGYSDLAIVATASSANVATVIHHRRLEAARALSLRSLTLEYSVCGAAALKEAGAEKVVAYCTHAVLSGSAVERIQSSVMDELVVTDTIPLREDARKCKKIRVLTVASLLAETMRRISEEASVSSLFVE